MPIGAYFQGEGDSVMADLKDRYGDKGGERAFYAIANKNKQKPGSSTGGLKSLFHK